MASFRSKKEVVYELLRESILKGEYKPGSRLVIDDVAATLGVSQIPIREALRQLEADGFVSTEPYIGVTITAIDANFIYEVFALLDALEVICGRAASRLMSDIEFDTLKRKIEAMDASLDKPDMWSQQNKDLHLFICECARTGLVTKMLTTTLDHWDRLRHHYLKDVSANRIPTAQAEHKQMLAAMLTRDPDEVERVIHKHNQSALSSYHQHLKTAGHLEQKGDFGG
jgi:DNA-binding GntR family transcriptional regulator